MTSKKIYVVEAATGVIKIGVSQWPEDRVETINTHSPCPCRLIATWDGDHGDERKLHDRFHQFRSHCEWFFPSAAVIAFVAEVRGRGVDRILDWVEITALGRAERWQASRKRQSEKIKALWANPEYRAKREADRRYWKVRHAIEAEHPDWSYESVKAEIHRRLFPTPAPQEAA